MATRKPFNASRAAGGLFGSQSERPVPAAPLAATPTAAPPAPPVDRDSANQPIPVSELARRIKQVIDDGFPSTLRVIGEVSRPNLNTHLYFRLKDGDTAVDASCFQGDLRTFAFRPKEGDKVIVTGRMDYWAKGGKLSILVQKIEPAGEGDLDARLRKLKAELLELGWFDPARKRPLPAFPRRVAIVTSATSAALADCLATARRRWPTVEIVVVDVRVQGAGAEVGIAAAIAAVDKAAPAWGLDALVVTRGGGSVEDLWCFNERIVAEAIHNATIPIVAAIGHEIDTSIAEMVADLRAPTPTAAMTALLPDRAELAVELDSLRDRSARGMIRLISGLRELLGVLQGRPALRDPLTPIAEKRRQLQEQGRLLVSLLRQATGRADAALDAQRAGLERAITQRVAQSKSQTDAIDGRLSAVSPLSVLERGYALVRDGAGAAIVRASAASANSPVTIQWADGSHDATINRSRE